MKEGVEESSVQKIFLIKNQVPGTGDNKYQCQAPWPASPRVTAEHQPRVRKPAEPRASARPAG